LYTLAERYLDLRESEVHIGFSLPLRVGGLWSPRTVADAPAEISPTITIDQVAGAPAATNDAPPDELPVEVPVPSAGEVAADEPSFDDAEPETEPVAATGDEPDIASTDALVEVADADGQPPGPASGEVGPVPVALDVAVAEPSVTPPAPAAPRDAPPSAEDAP
jgi:hypothetical protein